MQHLIVWGGTVGLESHRHIHRAFFNTARKIGIPATWAQDCESATSLLTPGSTVISADIYGHHLVAVPGVRYVLHNFDGNSNLCQQLDEDQLIRLQVWTNDATGEKWDECRSYDHEARTLFQPWGTDLLSEEFMEPVFNPNSVEATFVGAIWGEASAYGELGNMAAIDELKIALAACGLNLRHLTHIGDEENIAAVRSARLAPAIAGAWQVEHGYLPCRVFKNASYGCLTFSNVPEVKHLFGDSMVAGRTIQDVVENAIRIKRGDNYAMVMQQQRIAARYSYRQSIEAIDRAFACHQ